MSLGLREPKDRIVVALDVPTLDEATELARTLAPHVGALKVGLELLTAEGAPRVVEAIHALGGRVFYDGKFNDIPNTVAGAARAAARLGVWMFNVHASAGPEALAAAVVNKGESLVTAVTVLTSLAEEAVDRLFGASVDDKVLQFARMAAEAGVDGIICSPKELAVIRADSSLEQMATVVPGIRPRWAASQDQARIMTPFDAIRSGASAIVVGRPICQPPPEVGDPVRAVREIVGEIEKALSVG